MHKQFWDKFTVCTFDELHLKRCFYYKTELNIATKPRYVLGCQLFTVFSVLHFIHSIIIYFFFFYSLWSPDSGSKLLSEMNMLEDILTGNVYPDEYLKLFQLMDNSREFTQSWLYEEILENTQRKGYV